jgi:flavocytochrome c
LSYSKSVQPKPFGSTKAAALCAAVLRMGRRMINNTLSLLIASALLASCTPTKQANDADVIVVGAGIAGLSAALEASAAGASVVVLEAASVGGGHAVKAGGFAMTDTALQRRKGIHDSPELAFGDMLRWGEDANSYWAQRYSQESGSEVYDWLTNFGVEFVMILPTPENSVPRFHFTRGRALNVVVPLMRKALLDPNIRFAWNTRATALLRVKEKITGVVGRNERTGEQNWFRADSVVLSTGGFASNLSKVRENWPENQTAPKKLLVGSGQYATGDGYRLADWAGADMRHLDRQVIFYNGLPDPRDPTNTRALHAQNFQAIWVNKQGRRFVNESGDSKAVETAVSKQTPISYWVIYDANGTRGWQVRDALWLEKSMLNDVVVNNPDVTVSANSIAELAALTGIENHGLTTTIETWNRMVNVGTDFQFERFPSKNRGGKGQAITTAPFYATRLYPYTRKSMGGPAINTYGQVINKESLPIAGLFAAGELTGVAGINGKHGGSGTFLGPSVLTGRIAGRSAADASMLSGMLKALNINDATEASPAPANNSGMWHYEQAHARVAELGWSCDRCHSDRMPQRMTKTPQEMLARLETCQDCH